MYAPQEFIWDVLSADWWDKPVAMAYVPPASLTDTKIACATPISIFLWCVRRHFRGLRGVKLFWYTTMQLIDVCLSVLENLVIICRMLDGYLIDTLCTAADVLLSAPKEICTPCEHEDLLAFVVQLWADISSGTYTTVHDRHVKVHASVFDLLQSEFSSLRWISRLITVNFVLASRQLAWQRPGVIGTTL